MLLPLAEDPAELGGGVFPSSLAGPVREELKLWAEFGVKPEVTVGGVLSFSGSAPF